MFRRNDLAQGLCMNLVEYREPSEIENVARDEQLRTQDADYFAFRLPGLIHAHVRGGWPIRLTLGFDRVLVYIVF